MRGKYAHCSQKVNNVKETPKKIKFPRRTLILDNLDITMRNTMVTVVHNFTQLRPLLALCHLEFMLPYYITE